MLTTTLALAALSLSPGTPDERGITWYEGPHMKALGEAQAQEKFLVTYFWANTDNCSRLYGETMSDDGVITELGDMICYSAGASDDAGRKLFDRFGVQTVPALLVFGPDGVAEEMLLGFIDPVTFVAELQRIRRGENTITDLKARIAGEHESLEEELEQRAMLSQKLRNIGAVDEGQAMQSSIIEADPKGTTYTGAMTRVDVIVTRIAEEGGDDVAKWNLDELAKYAAKIKHGVGQFDARCQLASWQLESGDRSAGIKTYALAWKKRPAEERGVTSGGYGIIDRIAYLEGATSKEKKLALLVAEDLLALAEAVEPEPCAKCDPEGEVSPEDCGCDSEGDGAKGYAMYQVARCQALNGDEDEAIATMERLLEIQPEEDTYVSFLETLRTQES